MLRYIMKLLTLMALFLPVYLLLRQPWRRWERREAYLGLFWLFVAALMALVLEGSYQLPGQMARDALNRIREMDGINLIPFDTMKRFFRYTSRDEFGVNILGNILMFVPWGFGLPMLWKKNQKLWRLLFLCLAITVCIEFCQLFIQRNVDVDDLILNFTGGAVGAGLYFLTAWAFPKIKELAK